MISCQIRQIYSVPNRLVLATGYKKFQLSSLRLQFEAYCGLIINTVWTYKLNYQIFSGNGWWWGGGRLLYKIVMWIFWYYSVWWLLMSNGFIWIMWHFTNYDYPMRADVKWDLCISTVNYRITYNCNWVPHSPSSLPFLLPTCSDLCAWQMRN